MVRLGKMPWRRIPSIHTIDMAVESSMDDMMDVMSVALACVGAVFAPG